MNRDSISEMLVVGGLVTLLLLAAQDQWPYGFYVILKLYVCSATSYLGWKRVKESNGGWIFFYVPLAVLFNPIYKPAIASGESRAIDVLLAMVFGVIVVVAMCRSSQKGCRIWDTEPRRIATQPVLSTPIEKVSPIVTRNASAGISAAEPTDDSAGSDMSPVHPVSSGLCQTAESESIDQEHSDDLIRAEHGDVRAQVRLGLHFLKDHDRETALKWLLQAAYSGDPEAEYLVGCLSFNGDGSLSSNRAAMWIERAAKDGWVDAQCRLGWQYHTGQGVPKDDSTAAYWFGRAAESGELGAQYNLKILISLSQGIREEPTDRESKLMTLLGFKSVEDLQLWMNIPFDPAAASRLEAVYPPDDESDPDELDNLLSLR